MLTEWLKWLAPAQPRALTGTACWGLLVVISVISCQHRQPGSAVQQQNVVIQNITPSILSYLSSLRPGSIMRLRAASLAMLLGIVAARKEILKRHGDYFLRLQNQGGNLVLDEGKTDLAREECSHSLNYSSKEMSSSGSCH